MSGFIQSDPPHKREMSSSLWSIPKRWHIDGKFVIRMAWTLKYINISLLYECSIATHQCFIIRTYICGPYVLTLVNRGWLQLEWCMARLPGHQDRTPKRHVLWMDWTCAWIIYNTLRSIMNTCHNWEGFILISIGFHFHYDLETWKWQIYVIHCNG